MINKLIGIDMKWITILIIAIVFIVMLGVISLVWGMFALVGMIFLFGGIAIAVLYPSHTRLILPMFAIGILMLVASHFGLEVGYVDLSSIGFLNSVYGLF